MADFDFGSLDESGVVVAEEEEVVQGTQDNQPPTEPQEEVVEEVALEDGDESEYEEVEEDTPRDTVEIEEEPKKKKKKEPYTEAEIQEILANDLEIDTSRLSPAEQATMKAMQRGFTPKLQEAAELRREVERLREAVQGGQAQQEQPQDIYQAYDQDPEGVLQFVDAQIDELVRVGGAERLPEIKQLEALKYEFNRRDIDRMKQQTVQQAQGAQLMAALTQAIPDLNTKQQELTRFAIEELGYAPEELAYETNPAIHGERAVRNIIRINTAYEKLKAQKTVKKKRVKKPTSVEKPSNVSPEKPDVDELIQAKKKALETGDFKDFFIAMGEN